MGKWNVRSSKAAYNRLQSYEWCFKVRIFFEKKITQNHYSEPEKTRNKFGKFLTQLNQLAQSKQDRQERQMVN